MSLGQFVLTHRDAQVGERCQTTERERERRVCRKGKREDIRTREDENEGVKNLQVERGRGKSKYIKL